mmetsp:Transcript_92529/g.193455  ORF Transcript_92529/g.193455 Transcript_92529/m.193455 type:complete len:94 (+) Transcript_92529:78-359(+)
MCSPDQVVRVTAWHFDEFFVPDCAVLSHTRTESPCGNMARMSERQAPHTHTHTKYFSLPVGFASKLCIAAWEKSFCFAILHVRLRMYCALLPR